MITIFGWFGYELPMIERYRLIRQAGFDGVMIWWDDSYGDLDFRTFPALARREGLYVENIHTPFVGSNPLWLEGPEGEAKTEQLLRCIDDCHTYEIPTMVVHLMNGNALPPESETGLNRIRRLVDRAERKGVNIALENLQKAAFLTYVFEHINSDRLGFCFDSGHQNCFTPDEDALALYGRKLMALHLHDNNGPVTRSVDDDQHKLPFDGTVGWPNLMKKLAGTGYIGPTALEAGWDYTNLLPDPAEFLALAYDRARRLEDLRCDA